MLAGSAYSMAGSEEAGIGMYLVESSEYFEVRSAGNNGRLGLGRYPTSKIDFKT